jgi:hypothetical protein
LALGLAVAKGKGWAEGEGVAKGVAKGVAECEGLAKGGYWSRKEGNSTTWAKDFNLGCDIYRNLDYFVLRIIF